jgi:hypothetical protein
VAEEAGQWFGRAVLVTHQARDSARASRACEEGDLHG